MLSSKLSVSRHIFVADKKGQRQSDYLMRLIFHKAMCGGNNRAHKRDQIDESVGHVSFQHDLPICCTGIRIHQKGIVFL